MALAEKKWRYSVSGDRHKVVAVSDHRYSTGYFYGQGSDNKLCTHISVFLLSSESLYKAKYCINW